MPRKENELPCQDSTGEENDTKVTLLLPNEIAIEMVQVNELRHYEVFMWLVGLFSTAAIGFWTAYVANPQNALFGSACVFSFFAVAFLAVAIYYRSRVYHKSVKKSVSFKDFK